MEVTLQDLETIRRRIKDIENEIEQDDDGAIALALDLELAAYERQLHHSLAKPQVSYLKPVTSD